MISQWIMVDLVFFFFFTIMLFIYLVIYFVVCIKDCISLRNELWCYQDVMGRFVVFMCL